MKIFDGLENNQAIKMGDKYVVQLSGQFQVNGENISVYNQQVVVDSLADILGRTPEHKLVSYYTSGEEQEEDLSKEAHMDLCKKLVKFWDDEIEENVFPSVDDEIEHVKLKAYEDKFRPVYVTKPQELFPVDIQVVGESVDTGSEFIETPFQYGQAKFSYDGVFMVHLGSVAKDAVHKWCSEHPEVKVDIPNHGNVEFVKVTGQYVFTNPIKPWVKKADTKLVFTTLGKAQQAEGEVRSTIEKHLNFAAFPKKMDDLSCKDMVESLYKIKSRVNDIDPKQKSVSAKRATLQKIQEQIDLLMN